MPTEPPNGGLSANPPQPSGPSHQESTKTRFPIVGIGASAGGLVAFERFFRSFPPDVNPDMAFVLVQHLAPNHTLHSHAGV